MSTPPRPKILIVEDGPVQRAIYKTKLSSAAEVMTARSIEGAQKLFLEHQHDIALIVMDGEVEMEVLAAHHYELGAANTLSLVKAIRAQGFTKPILAASHEHNQALQDAGCNYAAEIKPNAYLDVMQLLEKMETEKGAAPAIEVTGDDKTIAGKVAPAPAGPSLGTGTN